MPRFSGTLVEDASAKKPRFSGTLVESPAQAAAPVADSLSWGDVGGQAVGNLLPSAGRFIGDLAQPFIHPVATAQALGDIGAGVAAKAGIGNADQSAADAVGQFFADRYGGMENFKRTMAQDPVGFASDLATVLSGGAGLGARAPGIIGTTARAAGVAGKVLDPVSAAGKVGGVIARPVGGGLSHAFGLSTGVGGEAIQDMVTAGKEGNSAALAQLRGTDPSQDIIDSAQRAKHELITDKNAQYNADMQPARADTTVLNFNGIDNALRTAWGEVTYKGVPKSEEAAGVVSAMKQKVDDWRQLNPADFHTPMGFDALKQSLSAIRDGTEVGTQARRVADRVYHAVSSDIEKQVPEYATAMRGYANSMGELNELDRTLSLGPNAMNDTTLRKLLSSARNNVNTNFGARRRLVDKLAAKEPKLTGMVAGRSMSSWEPRSISRLISPAMGAGGIAALPAYGPLALGVAGAGIAASSPRLVGEAAYGLGKLRGTLTPAQRRLISRTAFQTGRATDESKKRR